MAIKRADRERSRDKINKKRQPPKANSAERLLKVKLVRSLIGRPKRQREVIKGLGLRKINSEVIRKDCPEIWGMIRKTSHLIEVEVLEKK